MFFSKIGGISSKYSFFLPFLRCEHVRVDGRMDGCLLVICLLTLTTLSPPSLLIAIHTYLSLIYPAHQPTQTIVVVVSHR